MIEIWDLFDRRDYERAVEQKLINVQKHPDLDLWIHNYSKTANYTKGAWNNRAVRICRGLITDHRNQVIARPFPKFFNHNQPEVGFPNLMASAVVMDKADGSLGILYPTGRQTYAAGLIVPEYAVATRGSFTSEQALHATEIWREKYGPRWDPSDQWTYLFEIIYPENRIVLDYGEMDDLILLGAQITSKRIFSFVPGKNCPGAKWWPGPVATLLPHNNLASALKASPRENAEGMVVVLSDKMVKIKQEDYLLLHRLLTGFTARSIWEFLAVNACIHYIKKPKHWGTYLGIDPQRAKEIKAVGSGWKESYLENAPDEFLSWFDQKVEDITNDLQSTKAEWNTIYSQIRDKYPERRDFFKFIQSGNFSKEDAGAFGLLYDSRWERVNLAAWRKNYPSAHETPFREQGEDVA